MPLSLRCVAMARSRRAHGRPWWVIVFGASCLGLGLVVVSPAVLLVLGWPSERDWQRLSVIGQAYGVISAFIAAVALVGVVVSLNQQRRASQVDREHIYRTVHLDLIRILLDHPDLMASYGSVLGAEDIAERRLNIYCTQYVLSLQMGFEIGAIDDEYVRRTARELFASSTTHSWWDRVRDSRREQAATLRQERLLDILDGEWALSPTVQPLLTSAIGISSQVVTDDAMMEGTNQRRRCALPRWLRCSLVTGACVVATLVITRTRTVASPLAARQ